MDNKSHNSPSSKNQNENNLNKDLLKTILDNTYNEIFVYDDNFKVIYVNNACKRHYGLKPSEIIGKTLWDFKDCDIITRSKQMQDSIKLAKRAAKVDSTILIQGESGTGKGLLAKYIHKVSERKENSMFTINCAAIPEDLIEAELFGYSPGAQIVLVKKV